MQTTISHLFIDVSNSWTKYTLGSLTHLGKSHKIPTPEVNGDWIRKLVKSHGNCEVILSSVVPAKTKLFEKHWKKKKLFSVNGTEDLGFKIDYPKPASIGADRLANTAAAIHLYECPCVVVDFGTAVTFDVISSQGAYIGGVIAPGLNVMTDYLHQKTALLPHIEIKEPKHAIGRSTVEAMHAGAVLGYRGLVREILYSIKKELRAKNITVVATGGQAEKIAKNMAEIKEVRSSLTLEGLQYIARYRHTLPL